MLCINAQQRDRKSVDIVLRNKGERWRQYMDNMGNLADPIEREKSLTVSTLAFLRLISVGYDIKLTGGEKIGHIKVKGCRGEGRALLTRNERLNSRHLENDHYLYEVRNARSSSSNDSQLLEVLNLVYATRSKRDVHCVIDTAEMKTNVI